MNGHELRREEIGVELELKVLVLLERSKEGGLTGKAAERPQTQGGFRQATNLPTGEHEVIAGVKSIFDTRYIHGVSDSQ